MILCLDVHYEPADAVVACVGFERWEDEVAALEVVQRSGVAPAPYEPGQFYKREMPLLLSVIEPLARGREVEAIVIDGHVWLDEGKPGLGAHLFGALGGEVAVVGVAKTVFRGGVAVEVRRGQGQSPLFVTAAGMDVARAAQLVVGMHGPYRLPTLVKRADQLARGHARPRPGAAVSRFPE